MQSDDWESHLAISYRLDRKAAWNTVAPAESRFNTSARSLWCKGECKGRAKERASARVSTGKRELEMRAKGIVQGREQGRMQGVSARAKARESKCKGVITGESVGSGLGGLKLGEIWQGRVQERVREYVWGECRSMNVS